jgi:hypothetical protein
LVLESGANSDTSVDHLATSSGERHRPSPSPNHDPNHDPNRDPNLGHDRDPNRHDHPGLGRDRLRLVRWSLP